MARIRPTTVVLRLFTIALGTVLLSSYPPTALESAGATTTTTSAPLAAPKTSYAEDDRYFEDLARVDPSLSSYVEANEVVSLHALLTDGSAFCAFLNRGGGVDNAMAAVVIGAKSVESETHLPLSVATFNSIDAVALVDLCPTERKLLPNVDQGHIAALARSLSASANRG